MAHSPNFIIGALYPAVSQNVETMLQEFARAAELLQAAAVVPLHSSSFA